MGHLGVLRPTGSTQMPPATDGVAAADGGGATSIDLVYRQETASGGRKAQPAWGNAHGVG